MIRQTHYALVTICLACACGLEAAPFADHGLFFTPPGTRVFSGIDTLDFGMDDGDRKQYRRRRVGGSGSDDDDDSWSSGHDDYDDDGGTLSDIFFSGIASAMAYGTVIALWGNNPGSDFSYGPYPYADAGRFAFATDLEDELDGNSTRVARATDKRYNWFFRARLDLAMRTEMLSTGAGAFAKIESSYTPGIFIWHQQLQDMAHGRASGITHIGWAPKIVVNENLRLNWHIGSVLYWNQRGYDVSRLLYGLSLELWPQRPFMGEFRLSGHGNDAVDIYLGVGTQLNKGLFITGGYRGIFGYGETMQALTVGLTIAIGM